MSTTTTSVTSATSTADYTFEIDPTLRAAIEKAQAEHAKIRKRAHEWIHTGNTNVILVQGENPLLERALEKRGFSLGLEPGPTTQKVRTYTKSKLPKVGFEVKPPSTQNFLPMTENWVDSPRFGCVPESLYRELIANTPGAQNGTRTE